MMADSRVSPVPQAGLLLARLASSLLPSIRNQLSSYLTSLDVREGSKSINPNFESILGMLSQLEEILDEAKECIESATLDIIPLDTHDHHSKQFKNFRCTVLMSSIYQTMRDFRMLFRESIRFLEAWLDWSQVPESTECRDTTLKWVKNVLRRAAACNRTISKTLQQFHASDFEVIQDEWQREVVSLNVVLRFLTTLASPTTTLQRKPSAFRKHLIELAELTIPLLKLARIFFNRFTKRTPKKLPFKLDTELNSEILSNLRNNAAGVTRNFIFLMEILETSHESDFLVRDHTDIRKHLQDLSQPLDSTLTILASSFIPLTGGTHPGNSFKEQFLAWQDAWRGAVNNFLTILLSLGDQDRQQHPVPEQ
ncbi:hypothetical protein MJO29_008860 [Puccinia striiformis f. sp. tritici]|nr:hypothetical protein MJO29_008860 [Puccinia striiformis f. sp. tritici]